MRLKMTRPDFEFWFEYGSPYTYLTVARLDAVTQARGIAVAWRPFLLMPIMIDQGMPQGPFLPYPTKSRYMWRAVGRAFSKPSSSIYCQPPAVLHRPVEPAPPKSRHSVAAQYLSLQTQTSVRSVIRLPSRGCVGRLICINELRARAGENSKFNRDERTARSKKNAAGSRDGWRRWVRPSETAPQSSKRSDARPSVTTAD